MVMFYCVYTMHVTAETQKARNLMQVVSMQTKIAGTWPNQDNELSQLKRVFSSYRQCWRCNRE